MKQTETYKFVTFKQKSTKGRAYQDISNTLLWIIVKKGNKNKKQLKLS